MFHASILFFISLSALFQPLHAYSESIHGPVKLQDMKLAGMKPAQHLKEPSGLEEEGLHGHPVLLIFNHDVTLRPSSSRFPKLVDQLLQNQGVIAWVISAQALDNFSSQYKHISRINLVGKLGEETRLEDGTQQPEFLDCSTKVNEIYQELLPSAGGHDALQQKILKRKNHILFQDGTDVETNEAKAVRARMQQLAQTHPGYVYDENPKYATLSHEQASGELVQSILSKSVYESRDLFAMTFGNAAMDESMHKTIGQHDWGTTLSAIVTRNENKLHTWALTRIDDSEALERTLEKLGGFRVDPARPGSTFLMSNL